MIPTLHGPRCHAPILLKSPEDFIKERYGALGGAARLGVVTRKETGGDFDLVIAWHLSGGSALVYNAEGAAYLLGGAICEKWVRLGGTAFGIPDGDDANASSGWGRYADFSGQRTSIYWSATSGAFGLGGPIRAHWLALGGIAGPGHPISDETATPDGLGRFNRFEGGGAIYWTEATGATYLRGGI